MGSVGFAQSNRALDTDAGHARRARAADQALERWKSWGPPWVGRKGIAEMAAGFFCRRETRKT